MLVVSIPARAFDTNCYLLAPAAGEECVVVDPGIGVLDRLQGVLAEHRLKPAAVLREQRRKGVKHRRHRRKTAAYVRQGEWFFLPVADMAVDEVLVLKNEPLRRGNGGKPHWAEFCYRTGGETVYATDTVGFVRKLPHQLVTAFKTTLDVVRDADLLVHVVDGSGPDPEGSISAVQEVLDEIGAGDVPQLMVFNKADRSGDAARMAERYEGSLAVSAHTGHNIDLLRATIGDRVRVMTEYAEPVESTESCTVARRVAR